MSPAWFHGRMWQPDDPDTMQLLGDWIARWRARVGVSQRTLAARAGISQGGLSRVERGLQACGSRRLARLIQALDLLSRQGPMGAIDPPPIRRPSPARAPDLLPDDLPRSYVDEWLRRERPSPG
jgi:transcriptional regulator with XRE-family HTH domain